MIGAGVHLYTCVYMTPKKFEWHFSGRAVVELVYKFNEKSTASV